MRRRPEIAVQVHQLYSKRVRARNAIDLDFSSSPIRIHDNFAKHTTIHVDRDLSGGSRTPDASLAVTMIKPGGNVWLVSRSLPVDSRGRRSARPRCRRWHRLERRQRCDQTPARPARAHSSGICDPARLDVCPLISPYRFPAAWFATAHTLPSQLEPGL